MRETIAAEGDGAIFATIDTDVLLEFVREDRLELLGRNPAFQFIVSDTVYTEVENAGQKAKLDRAISRDYFRRSSLDQMEALQLYQELRKRLDKGEAACIALSSVNGWHVASDEKGALEELVESHLGRGKLLTSADILLRSIQEGLLDADEADAIKDAFSNEYSFQTFDVFL